MMNQWGLPEPATGSRVRTPGGTSQERALGKGNPNNVMDAYFEPVAWWLRKKQSSHHATASKRVITGVRFKRK